MKQDKVDKGRAILIQIYLNPNHLACLVLFVYIMYMFQNETKIPTPAIHNLNHLINQRPKSGVGYRVTGSMAKRRSNSNLYLNLGLETRFQ